MFESTLKANREVSKSEIKLMLKDQKLSKARKGIMPLFSPPNIARPLVQIPMREIREEEHHLRE